MRAKRASALDGSSMKGAPRALAKAMRSRFFKPMSGRAIIMPSRAVIRSMPRNPATPDPRNSRKHGLRLIVGVMSGHECLGADLLCVIDEQAVARLARVLLQAACWLHASPLKNAMADAEPRAERSDGLGLVGAFRSQP